MERYDNPKRVLQTGFSEKGQVAWRSPSNIALVKYWGKYGRQMPANPSVSLTLQEAYTETKIFYSPKETPNPGIELEFRFEGKPNPSFAGRIQKYLESLEPVFPFLAQLRLRIESQNSFPHSTGIASSASAMSALALGLCDLEQILFETPGDKNEFLRKASYVARLGSGSACRSLFPVAAVWGQNEQLPEASQEFAIGIQEKTDPVFHSFHDDILLVSRKKKEVSSTAGHQLMKNHPFAEIRFQQANNNLASMLKALASGDLDLFGQVLEQEALTLHGLMMSSKPPFILLEPNTITLIRKVRQFREETRCPLYFTLDAGPNLHLLYPDTSAEEVKTFIRSELKPLCQDQQVIEDAVGQGSVKI